jgi:hypothetical protein
MNSSIVREALLMVWRLVFRCGLKRSVSKVHPKSVASRV